MGITIDTSYYLPVGVEFDPVLVMAAIENAIQLIDTATEISNGIIVNDHIVANTIVANEKLYALSIQAGQIESDAVISRTIQANAVTADKISVTDLAAVSTSTGTLTVASGGYIVSDPFTSGALGQGFKIWASGLAEFNNIYARGKISTSVFEKTAVSSIGGNLLVSDSDTLSADMTALDNSTLTISGDTTFAVNDILRIKDGTDDEWLTVTNVGSAPTYTVTRDGGSAYAANTNPIWKKGTAVINYGASGEGLIYMTASDTNSPHIDVLTHAGSPWDTTTTQLRLGNLNGFLGYSTDLYGIAIGETTKFLKYDSTNGLQVRGNIDADSGNLGTMTIDGALSIGTSGTIGSGQTAYDTGTGYWLEYNGGTPRVSLGNASGNKLTWNGTALNITGVVSMSAGSSIEGLDATNVAGWAHASDATLIDGGDIYTNSITVSKLGTGIFGSGQLLDSGNFEDWSAGTSSAPDGWGQWHGLVLPTIARESTTIKLGTYSCKLTAQDGDAHYVAQTVSTEKGIAYWKGRTVTFGCWVWSDSARTRILISDYSNYVEWGANHTGDSAWEWMTVTATIPESAASVDCCISFAAGADDGAIAYFDGAMCVEGSYAVPFADKVHNYGHPSDYTKIDGGDIYTGTVTADKVAAGTFVGGNFVIGSGGAFQTDNYVADTTGVRLDHEGLEINQGATIMGEGILETIMIYSMLFGGN